MIKAKILMLRNIENMNTVVVIGRNANTNDHLSILRTNFNCNLSINHFIYCTMKDKINGLIKFILFVNLKTYFFVIIKYIQ